MYLKTTWTILPAKEIGNQTPAELAGISLGLDRNKTFGLIYILRLLGPEEFIKSRRKKIKKENQTINFS